MDQKLNWLKRSGNLSLPNHPNRDSLEATADLLIRYADVIGTENGIKGTFIRAVRIPTNRQSRTPKQHSVAQALEADIDAEIKRMATVGINESSTNPRGFNSLVLAVRKKNPGRSAWSPISKELSTMFLLISTHTQCLRSTTCSTGLAKATNILHHLISAAAKSKSKSTSEIATKQRLRGETGAISTHAYHSVLLQLDRSFHAT